MEKKNNKMKEIMEQLESGVADVFTSEKYKRLLKMFAQFHNYSLNNCILIISQMPEASRCASFATWKRLGFVVKKGSKGIKVIVPIPYRYEREKEETDENGETVTVTETAEGLGFKVGNVFDVSQVSGDFPKLAHELTDNSQEIQKAVDSVISQADNIFYDKKLIGNSANGYYSLADKTIHLRPDMSALQTFKTLVHEKAHSILHADKDCPYNRNEAEVQAESCAYTVCSALGLDVSDYSFGYIAGWSKGKELKELKSSLALIERTAKELLRWLENATDLRTAEGF